MNSIKELFNKLFNQPKYWYINLEVIYFDCYRQTYRWIQTYKYLETENKKIEDRFNNFKTIVENVNKQLEDKKQFISIDNQFLIPTNQFGSISIKTDIK